MAGSEGRGFSVPRYVDPEERVRDIVAASLQALSEGGLAELTLRKIAQRMGGSITLITHYFANREALLDAVLKYTLADADSIHEELDRIEDPWERLRVALEWFLPDTEEALTQERARVALLTHQGAEPVIRQHLERMEPAMRSVLRRALDALVPAGELDGTVDMVRVWVSGIALSVVEHPEIWTPERQHAALKRFLTVLSSAPLPAG
ncbi:TetR family transcriptional regulator [Streptomyces sp. TLI_55]|uniref:TetR/AcrR family transcriptional regulator n=1 Tax=Streptomyces sp. TLI_55 TaxID=1938861 RepID=UPI000BD5C39C|nr:TetR/AcrR family transcriptional regulator [Streptomyces sp. TLI_55]SNX88477.1 TetR family transcriptional regulator [Streptomyces sp. TLI_55]